MTLSRQLLQDTEHLGEEAEVEHVVALVQDQLLDLVEPQAAALDVVEQAPGGSDDDVRLLADAVHLRPHLDPADQADGPELVVLTEEVEEGFGLEGDLAGRRDDEAADPAAMGEPFGQGEDEGGGLARAGLGEADQVPASERERDDLSLDGRGMDEPDLAHDAQDRFRETEGFKGFVSSFYRVLWDGYAFHASPFIDDSGLKDKLSQNGSD